ncbi:hypothetical protein ACQVP2_22365 [Methylobacterium aquaticum]|uniref:hypothetical protein n=1 Tax=Methylobacterium aquaticum TaxID=270351 RepID=UPI003D18610C
MNIRRSLLAFGALGLAKTWNEEDHPRDADGKFSSGGGGGSEGEDEDEEYGPGEGYDPEDQERHDRAMADLAKHAAKLEDSINRAATVFHDPSATAEQIIAAGKEVQKHHKSGAKAYDAAYEVRSLYGDAYPEDPGLGNAEDLIGGIEAYREAHDATRAALKTLRTETSSRVSSVVRTGRSSHDDAITQLERDLETISGSFAARRAAMRSTSV